MNDMLCGQSRHYHPVTKNTQVVDNGPVSVIRRPNAGSGNSTVKNRAPTWARVPRWVHRRKPARLLALLYPKQVWQTIDQHPET